MVTVVLTVFALASLKMHYSIKNGIRDTPIFDENAWIRVFRLCTIGIYRHLSASSGKVWR